MAKPLDESAPVIECLENGPYLVKNLNSMMGVKGEAVSTKPTMALCRCGGSMKKPFCDGTHAHNGFSGKKDADGGADKRETYVGKKITIHDNRGPCAHAGYCTDDLAAVFRMKQEPWIDPDGAAVDAITQTINRCPSGALSYTIDEVEYRDQDRSPRIHIAPDGPYALEGNIELKNVACSQDASSEHRTLCRCGHSKNKPFCDGSHWAAGFKDP